MHEFNKILIRNPIKYNGFIHRLTSSKHDFEKDLENQFIFVIIYNYILCSPILIEAINKETKSVFLDKCAEINRHVFFFTLKSGFDKTRLAQNTDGITIPDLAEHEIEDINLFLSNNSTERTNKTINAILSRSFMHHFSEIDADEHQGLIGSLLSDIRDNNTEITSFSELKNRLYEVLFHESDNFSSSINEEYLFYFLNGIKCEKTDYTCFYKPVFQALSGYRNYLIKLLETDNTQKSNDSFTALTEDFRDGYPGRLSFDDVIDQKQFTYLEELLFEDNIIDSYYNFIQKRGNKKNLAIIYKFIIKEGYFRKSNYKQRSNFQEYHYRQYLDHRYNVDTSQQFKNTTDKDVKLYFQSKRWKYDLTKLINTDFFKLNSL